MVRRVVVVCTARRLPVLQGMPPRIAQRMAHGLLLVGDNGDGGAIARLLESRRTWRPQLEDAAVREPVPGLAPARNQALEASRAADLLTFVDDDAVPPSEDGRARVLEAVARHPRGGHGGRARHRGARAGAAAVVVTADRALLLRGRHQRP